MSTGVQSVSLAVPFFAKVGETMALAAAALEGGAWLRGLSARRAIA
jgi:hypothetical protein